MNVHWLQKNGKILYSPFREMILSLHVIANPLHHPLRMDWAKNTYAKFSEQEKKEFHEIEEASLQFLVFFDWYTNIHTEDYVELGIDRLRTASNETFHKFFSNLNKEKVCDFLFHYHQNHFARELARIEPWLIKSTIELQQALQNRELSLFKNLHPRFEIQNDRVLFYKARTWEFRFSDLTSIVFYPSTFVEPHLLLDEIDPIHIKMVYKIDFGAEKVDFVPKDLLSSLHCIADETRLRILRDLSHTTYCTQQLVDRYQLSKSTISGHLKILEANHLVRKCRQGHYVFYETNRVQLEQLRVELDQFIDFPIE